MFSGRHHSASGASLLPVATVSELDPFLATPSYVAAALNPSEVGEDVSALHTAPPLPSLALLARAVQ